MNPLTNLTSLTIQEYSPVSSNQSSPTPPVSPGLRTSTGLSREQIDALAQAQFAIRRSHKEKKVSIMVYARSLDQLKCNKRVTVLSHEDEIKMTPDGKYYQVSIAYKPSDYNTLELEGNIVRWIRSSASDMELEELVMSPTKRRR